MVDLIAKHRSRGILIDTNILLLYMVGLVEPAIVANRRFKRTETFSLEDFEMLEGILEGFRVVVTTPSILTETSNLLGQLAEPARSKVFEALGRSIAVMKERYVAADRLQRESIFIRFGLTDSSILLAARNGFLILTDDFPLSNFLASEGLDVINFNHLRLV
ncbi:MAG TPA: PIN domain-containing protein [Tepidisphaeraceae bacterium]